MMGKDRDDKFRGMGYERKGRSNVMKGGEKGEEGEVVRNEAVPSNTL